MNGQNIVIVDRSIKDILYPFLKSTWFICEQNQKSLDLTSIDLDKILTKTVLNGREKEVDGEERLVRLKKKGYVLLDIGVAETLLKNPNLFPERWKRKTGKGIPIHISFDGTILQNYESRCKYFFSLYWEDNTVKEKGLFLDTQIPLSTVSAVLEN